MSGLLIGNETPEQVAAYNEYWRSENARVAAQAAFNSARVAFDLYAEQARKALARELNQGPPTARVQAWQERLDQLYRASTEADASGIASQMEYVRDAAGRLVGELVVAGLLDRADLPTVSISGSSTTGSAPRLMPSDWLMLAILGAAAYFLVRRA